MIPRRYALIIADRRTGVVHRFTLSVRPAVALVAAILSLPIGWTVHSHWTAQTQIEGLQLQNARLELENSSYRTTATQLSSDIASLQSAMENLAVRSNIDPRLRRSVDGLPETLRAAAIGTRHAGDGSAARTFTLLDDLLGTLNNRLAVVRDGVARREALAQATPNTWPADGWVSASYGYRQDPFTGEREFHPAVDIRTYQGQPVYAAATGRVVSADASGNYGNLIKIDHGFGLNTRYGHLSRFAVVAGDTVQGGDIIGFAGATGRATGYHVHYEVWANGRTINPLRLLPDSRPAVAN